MIDNIILCTLRNLINPNVPNAEDPPRLHQITKHDMIVGGEEYGERDIVMPHYLIWMVGRRGGGVKCLVSL